MKRGILIIWCGNPWSSAQGGCAQMKNVLPALKNQSEENIDIWFYLKLKRIKIDFISYLSLGYAVLSRGMQYEMNDYSSAQKSQRENPSSVKTQLRFSVWPGRSDRP